jgi:hypothetical protein
VHQVLQLISQSTEKLAIQIGKQFISSWIKVEGNKEKKAYPPILVSPVSSIT